MHSAALLRSPDLPGPVTVGLWRPVLLLPATFIENHSRTEFLAAVAHECAHIKRNDFGKNVFYEIVGLFTDFIPRHGSSNLKSRKLAKWSAIEWLQNSFRTGALTHSRCCNSRAKCRRRNVR